MTSCACDLDKGLTCMLHTDLDGEILSGVGFFDGLMHVNYITGGQERTKYFTSKKCAQAFIHACDRSNLFKVTEYSGFEMGDSK